MYLINSAYGGVVLKRWDLYAFGSRLKGGMYGMSEESESGESFPGLRLYFGMDFVGCIDDVVVSGATATVWCTVRTS